MTAKTQVWHGSPDLQDSLVPIGDLEPFPGNPRRGDTTAVAASLRRFGQVKPIVIDGKRIVAGHTLVRAAEGEGWTHIAAASNLFGSEEEQRAYLLADNRASDLGQYDDTLLYEQLAALESREGTGYDERDTLALAERLRAIDGDEPGEFPPLHPGAVHVEYECPSCGYEWSGQPRPAGE